MKQISKRIKQVFLANNEKLDNTKLLNWYMNQLYRAARVIDLLHPESLHPASLGCDAAALSILERLLKTKRGKKLIKETHPGIIESLKKLQK